MSTGNTIATLNREERVTTSAAAKILGARPATLRTWRRLGRGPKYVKFYSLCAYRIGDLEEFLAARTVEPQPRQEEACV
jgi:transposase-like protein